MKHLLPVLLFCLLASPAAAQDAAHAKEPPAGEEHYYPIATLPIPEDVVLEVGGLALMPDGSVAASTRRGEVWIVENPYVGDDQGTPYFRRFAHGLHEALGLAYYRGGFYAAQRGELTRLRDRDGDGRADVYEAVYSWPLSGNYHEYSYGPVIRKDGTLMVTLNLAWIGHGASPVPWRGWTLEITPDGKMTPFATGMRSPAGFTLTSQGDFFYAENQGDWVGSGFIAHVERGDFVGNPAGLAWTDLPGSPLHLKPEDIPDTSEPKYEVSQRVPQLKNPAVWFPHGLMGISTSGIVEDTTRGAFGPFTGQLFVGDQGHSKIMRVSLEKVKGVYQGAVYPFREGFASGVLRLIWGKDGSMFVGQTSRGWSATGEEPYALQRVVYTGEVPFEAQRVEARPDGFEVVFTQPVDPAAAGDASSYDVTGFTYEYHHEYGSPVIDQVPCPVRGVQVSDDGMRARLVVDGLREGYIHELKMGGVRSAGGDVLLHDVAYYTLNRLPDGEPLRLAGTRPPAPQREAGTNGKAAAAGPKRLTGMPASWTGGPDATLTIATVPGLRYDTEEVRVKAGSKVRIVFNNDDDMLHNLVVTAPASATEVADLALQMGLAGQQKNYVPESDLVLFHTNLLQPETSESIYFVAPSEPGEYVYVCTFPGHSATMRGILRVE